MEWLILNGFLKGIHHFQGIFILQTKKKVADYEYHILFAEKQIIFILNFHFYNLKNVNSQIVANPISNVKEKCDCLFCRLCSYVVWKRWGWGIFWEVNKKLTLPAMVSRSSRFKHFLEVYFYCKLLLNLLKGNNCQFSKFDLLDKTRG